MAHPLSIAEDDDCPGAVASAPAAVARADALRRQADAICLARIRAGDSAAFADLFRRYYLSLNRLATRYMRASDSAQDIVMEVFLAVWRKRSELVIRGDIAAYLHAAVRHRAMNTLTRQRLERTWKGAFAAEGKSPAFSERHPESHEAVEQEELAIQCAEALARLPRRARQCVEMRFMDGMRRGEIADALGISVSTVKAHLNTAMRALRATFGAS